jgi:hypothetical protein
MFERLKSAGVFLRDFLLYGLFPHVAIGAYVGGFLAGVMFELAGSDLGLGAPFGFGGGLFFGVLLSVPTYLLLRKRDMARCYVVLTGVTLLPSIPVGILAYTSDVVLAWHPFVLAYAVGVVACLVFVKKTR